MQTNDIEGTSSSPMGIKTKRVINPLNPEYKLPTPNPVLILLIAVID
jgi:hypothetical protein